MTEDNPVLNEKGNSAEPSAIRHPHPAIVVLTTIETSEQAATLAQLLVEQELAACVQILPPMTSVYRWQGQIERATETLLLIKTLRASYPAVEAAIRAYHPYQTPEIIALPMEAGAEDYLAWLHAAIKK